MSNLSAPLARVTIPPADADASPRTQSFDKSLDDIIVAYRLNLSELAKLTEELSNYSAFDSLWVPSTPPPDGAFSPTRAVSPMPMHTVDFSEGTKQPSESEPSSPLHRVLGRNATTTTSFTSFSSVQFDKEDSDAFQSSRRLVLVENEFKAREEWEGDAASLQIDLAKQSVRSKGSTSSVNCESSVQSLNSYSRIYATDWRVVSGAGVQKCIISSPSEPTRVAWEFFGIILVLYDLLEIPLAISFELPRSLFQNVLEWVVRVYWTLNIPVVLTTGYISEGILIMNMYCIARRYCKTWLIVDVITIIPDWLYFVLAMLSEDEVDGNESGSLIRAVRLLRLWRITRLMRFVKLRTAWDMIYDILESEKLSILCRIFKNILLLMLVTHYIACMWFAVGSAQHGESWLKFHKYTDTDADWEQQFLASYHWSLTQLTPSSVNIFARSESERLFSIGAVIFGMVGFSYLVGSITSSLARLQSLRERKASNFWSLRRYLKKNKVPHELCVRIRAYVESQWERQEELKAISSIESLNLLSENLKVELRCSIEGPTFSIHPLFEEMLDKLHDAAMRLMIMAISHLYLAPQDMMFTAGVDATKMSFLRSGVMHYERMHSGRSRREGVQANEDWIAEPVLWVRNWCHLGDLRSAMSTELLQVHPETLAAVARDNPLVFSMFASYAKEYLAWLSQFSNEFLSDITKKNHAHEELTRIVSSISRDLDLKPRLSRQRPISPLLPSAFKML